MIDTSTTSGKIQVMQAKENGKVIEYKVIDVDDLWCQEASCSWNWGDIKYRIKPQTLEEAIEEAISNLAWIQCRSDIHSELTCAFNFGVNFLVNWQKEQDNE